MNLIKRVEVLSKLGEQMKSLETDAFQTLIYKTEIENPWFTSENILKSLAAVRDQFLSISALQKIINKYHIDDNIKSKRIGLILAGNIPLVGVHDLICCFLCGHISLIKYSDKDKTLMKWFSEEMIRIDHDSAAYIIEVDRLKDYDAAIATGSNASAVHFEYYFRHVPHIIRRNRNSIAVLSGNETPEQLRRLGDDVFSYFGLGCRNVSLILVPEGYDITLVLDAFEPFKELMYHNKYKNNYDYNQALMLLNKETFLQSEFLILKQSDQVISRIASLHYQYYKNQDDLITWLRSKENEIQCIVTDMYLPQIESVGLGMAQCPAIDDFADGVDTFSFLLRI
ncbi:MAG: acyl-CoA reductase [Saprospiraceae bacterium]|jgi:hypothetical protein|nr:hypothetical protein [Saprospiraceae bacterium]MBK9568364.1 hypothetical protein [Saprospiraceae bacterium]MBP6447408.1 acyl-CoA reductase [Saprospiraceae bacterium]